MAAARSKRPGNHRAKATSQPATGKGNSRTDRHILVSARRRGRGADRFDGAATVAAPELPLRAVQRRRHVGREERQRRRRGVAERAAVREDRDVLAGVLRGLRHWGAAACGLTHAAVTPLDVIKCNIQIDPAKYKSTSSAFGIVLKEQGVRGFYRGWAPTFLGYSAQGAFKYGLYEVFKKQYSDMVGPEYAAKYKTLVYLAGSATAEVVADVALCPMEAVKVRVQTQPGYAKGLRDGFPKIVRSEGYAGLFRGMVPLWGRQIPYTMMKFATYENIVEMAYKHLIPTPKDQTSKPIQLGVSFGSGYVAGVFCAAISHPADNLVSFLNNAKGATVADAVKNLGVWGLFTRGLPLRILMIGTLTGTQWVIYDAFKVMAGFPTTGGAPAAVRREELTEGQASA